MIFIEVKTLSEKKEILAIKNIARVKKINDEISEITTFNNKVIEVLYNYKNLRNRLFSCDLESLYYQEEK